MVRLLLTSLVLSSMVFACKPRTSGSQAKSEKDIEDGSLRWVDSEGKFAIRCRDGKLHNGFKSTLIRTEDLKHACEQNDPNWPPQGGGNPGGGGGNPGGGGGTVIGGEVSLEQCAALVPPRPIDPRVAQLSIALAPELQAEILAVQPTQLRSTRLCNGVGGQLAQLVANDETFNLFKGVNGNPPITLLVGIVGTPVKFNKYDPSLTLPWQIDNNTVAQINQEIAATGGNILCGTSAKYALNKCWYLGAGGQSCDQVCQGKGKLYTAFTTSIPGTIGGTAEACTAICKEFGYGNPAQATNPTGVYDCFIEAGACKRDGDNDGNSQTSANAGYMRICQCQ